MIFLHLVFGHKNKNHHWRIYCMLQVNNLKNSACARLLILLLLLSSFVGAAAAADKVVVTSGRVVYDAFGRAVKTYHPTVDSDTVVLFSTALDAVRPTVTVYDELDRPIRVTHPDGTVTATGYDVVGTALVTRVTDALGHTSDTHVTASGKTLKSVRYNSAGLTNAITTQYAYDGLGRLVSVTDADGNVTESEYDMGDRRVRVVHPASGETRFTYDALGNVLTRQTANLRDRDSTLFIVYGYDRGRLVSVSYPKHPENDVRYYYGGENDHSHAKGRLCYRRDATGGEQFAYDNMGNVSQRLRTVTVPNEAVVTFKTEFEYDSYGKLLSMTYPDAEKVCYWYDASGQLSDVYVNDRKKGDYYVEEIGYDKFGDRVYMRYGNGATAEYAYDAQMRRLVHRLDTLSHERPVSRLERTYVYDLVGNITSLQATGDTLLFDPVSHTYGYDHLYRLTSATGNTGSDPNGYTLAMTYDKMYRVKTKKQHLWQKDIQFGGALLSGYDLSYSYSTAPGRRFQMSMVSDLNYRAEGSHSASDNVYEKHYYEYDPNGNILHVRTSRRMADKDYRELAHEERFRWDEENRLMAIAQDGYVSNYWYDADGERVIKEHGGNQAVFVNSLQDSVLTDTRQFTVYPSPYLVVHNGDWYTKHIYIGAERIASRMGILPDGLSFGENESAGGNVFEDIHYSDQCDMMAQVMKSNYEYFGLPYNGENRHAEDGDGMVSTDPRGGGAAGLTRGGPRYYWMMADAGDGEGGTPGGSDRAGKGNRYYYHSDHLGSSSLITDDSCHVTQQMDYLPYGEVFLERRRHSDPSQPLYATPYKFNGKELDEETGLYYYGARYMNPRLSIWYATDPLQEKYPNTTTYSFVLQNPINHVDFWGDSTFLYATSLPGGADILRPATHTFIVVEKENGQKIKFSYGPQEDGTIGSVFGSKLVRKNYPQDRLVMDGNASPDVVKARIPIMPPQGLTISEFDEAVIRSGNSFGSVEGIIYTINANSSTSGNCNSSSSTLLYKAGLTKSDILLIREKIPGIKWGFGDIKPWTKSEQIKAVQKEKQIRENRIRHSINDIHLRR